MTKIVFRQKTEAEKQTDAAKRAPERAPEVRPPAVELPPAVPAVAAEGSGFALESGPMEPKTRKRRKK